MRPKLLYSACYVSRYINHVWCVAGSEHIVWEFVTPLNSPARSYRHAGVGMERRPSDRKDLRRSAVHHGPAMCRGGALRETVSSSCRHLSPDPTENLSVFSSNMATLRTWIPSPRPPFPFMHSTRLHQHHWNWLLNWLIFSYKFPVLIQTATLICCLTLSIHKPWSTISSSRLVCTRICWYACMHVSV